MLRLLLLNLSELYASARGLSISRVSTLVFSDGKVLTRIAGGGDITTSRFETAIGWFSNNWPDGEPWPVTETGILSHFSSPASSSAGAEAGASVTPPAQKDAPVINSLSPEVLPSGEVVARCEIRQRATATNSVEAVR